MPITLKGVINRDEKLDQLLSESANDHDRLAPLVARYAEIATTSNTAIIESYIGPIEDACSKWESEIPEIKGLRMLSIALSKFFTTKFHEAMEPCAEAIEILEDSPYKDLCGLAHITHGANYRSLGEFDIAVEHLMIGADGIDPAGKLAMIKCLGYYQLAEINVHINDYEAAEKNYQIAINIAEQLNNKAGLFRAYNGMANFHISQNNLEKCKHFLDLSLSIEGLTDSQKSRSYCDLGIYYQKKNDFVNAEKNLIKSYELRIESGLRHAASTSLINMAMSQIELNQFEKALNSLKQALEICLEYKSKSKLLECYHLLAKVYEKQEEWKKSTESYKKYDELQIELNTKQLQNIYKLKNGQIQKQKAVIEEAHKEITDSINYARRIQSAILPSSQFVKSYLKDSFILYKPKDIVAGDFYWFEVHGDEIYFAAADCTGHGVPGAMVSVVCANALNRAVNELKITEPSKILDKVREFVVETFEKSDEDVKDGMDISFCKLNLKTRLLSFSGAHNPLYRITPIEGELKDKILRNDSHMLLEYKGDKQPIGKFAFGKPFTQQEIQLLKGDSIYISTDGYPDQFGGEKGRKFMYKPFKKLFLDIHSESMEKQKFILVDSFETWRGKQDQVDDVCIIGVRI